MRDLKGWKRITCDDMWGIHLSHWLKVWKLQKQLNITIQWIGRNSNWVGWGKRRNYGKTKECIDGLLEKCQKQQMKKKHGTGWEKLTWKLKRKPCYVLRKIRQFEKTMWNTDKTAQSTLCRMCGTKNETISHIVNECKKLVQKVQEKTW